MMIAVWKFFFLHGEWWSIAYVSVVELAVLASLVPILVVVEAKLEFNFVTRLLVVFTAFGR